MLWTSTTPLSVSPRGPGGLMISRLVSTPHTSPMYHHQRLGAIRFTRDEDIWISGSMLGTVVTAQVHVPITPASMPKRIHIQRVNEANDRCQSSMMIRLKSTDKMGENVWYHYSKLRTLERHHCANTVSKHQQYLRNPPNFSSLDEPISS